MDELEEQKVLAKRLREFFSSPDEAASSALNKINERNYELGGVISQAGDRYYASEPQGNRDTKKFEARVRLPKGEKPVAIYHTHPGDEVGELFSSDDLNVADQMKMLSYIKALNSGNIRKYEPGKTPVRNFSRMNRMKVSDGELLEKQQALAAALLAPDDK